MIRERNFEMSVLQGSRVRRPASRGDHLGSWIDAPDASTASDHIHNSQGRFARPRRYVKNIEASRNPCILDKSIRNRTKHPSDRFSMFIPIWGGLAPLAICAGVFWHNGSISLHQLSGACKVGCGPEGKTPVDTITTRSQPH